MNRLFVLFSIFLISCSPPKNETLSYNPNSITIIKDNFKYYDFYIKEELVDIKEIYISKKVKIKFPDTISSLNEDSFGFYFEINGSTCSYSKSGSFFIKDENCPSNWETESSVFIKNIKNKSIYFKLGILF